MPALDMWIREPLTVITPESPEVSGPQIGIHRLKINSDPSNPALSFLIPLQLCHSLTLPTSLQFPTITVP